MKKILLITLLLLSIAIGITACGEKEAKTDKNSTKKETATAKDDETADGDLEALGDVDVDEGIFNVEMTIPAEYIGEKTQDDLNKISEEHGFKSIVLNKDGSATYTMTKKQHKELLDEYRRQINNGLDEMIGSENYPNFTKIKSNDNFTQFTVTTKSAELDMNESFSTVAFYMYGGMYSVFSGKDVDNISVTFVNADTGEIIETANSSDMKDTE